MEVATGSRLITDQLTPSLIEDFEVRAFDSGYLGR